MIEATAPHWTAYVQALGTPFVALVAGAIASWIAYQQWQTAKAKVVLDLFEERLEVYKLVTDAVAKIIMHGPPGIDNEVTGPFANGLLKSKFLFGQEVYSYLNEIWLVMNRLVYNNRAQPRAMQEDRLDELLNKEDEMMSKIVEFSDRFDRMMIPYLRMDQKLPRSRLLPAMPRIKLKLWMKGRARP